MRDLVLTGFMGTGKSTLAQRIADRYGLRCIDLDQEIERRRGKSVGAIFSEDGEPEFRRMERELVAEIAEFGEGRVIATGGGTLVSDETAGLLRSDQRVVTLTCDPDLALKRARSSERPLLNGASREDVLALWDARKLAYDRFPQVDTSDDADPLEEIGRLCGLRSATQYTVDQRKISDVQIERGGLSYLPRMLSTLTPPGHVLIVTDATVRALPDVDQVVAAIRRECAVTEAVIAPGEDRKDLATLGSLYKTCLEAQLDRDAVVVGIGGGVIGDIAGMVAATYLRGLRLVLVPTTLLAQVDAAIGGKVGIDLEGVKNMIGAFHPAQTVLIDPDLLASLPDPLLGDGLAEVVKIGAIRCEDLFVWADGLANAHAVVHEPSIVRRAVIEKVRVVREDPHERGVRALLNFGHTVGHAIETAADFRLSHGSCVAIGMVAETHLAEQRGWCENGCEARLRTVLTRLGLPCHAPTVDPAVAFEFMGQDKKRTEGQFRFATPERMGHGVVVTVSAEDARESLRYAMSTAA